MHMTDFAYDGPIFLVPLSPSYPSSPVLCDVFSQGILKAGLSSHSDFNNVLNTIVHAFSGGKPVHITGKPIQFTGKPSQMGLLQGQTLSIVSQPVGEGGNLGTPQTIGKALNQGTGKY